MLRRASARTAGGQRSNTAGIRFGDFCLSVDGRELGHDVSRIVPLTTLEFDLLAVLVSNAHRVMSRKQLLEQAAGRNWSPFDRAVCTAIIKLRRKMEDDPRCSGMIKAARGVATLLLLVLRARSSRFCVQL